MSITMQKTQVTCTIGGQSHSFSSKIAVSAAERYICPSPPRLNSPTLKAKQTPRLEKMSKACLSSMLPKYQKDVAFTVKNVRIVLSPPAEKRRSRKQRRRSDAVKEMLT